MLRDFESHDTPLAVLEFNNSVPEEWRGQVLEALHSVGIVGCLHAYSTWTVQPNK